jgi:hypothetical protein
MNVIMNYLCLDKKENKIIRVNLDDLSILKLDILPNEKCKFKDYHDFQELKRQELLKKATSLNTDFNIIKKAYEELFEKLKITKENRKINIIYSNRFKDYNSNVKYSSKEITFNLSSEWKVISEEIQIGLIQFLASKLYSINFNSINIDLYNHFIKNLSNYSNLQEEHEIHNELLDSFNRVNNEYFSEMLDRPNLVWGQDSKRTLGHYNYQNNTITISTILKGQLNLLDYVMYHELLHKKL